MNVQRDLAGRVAIVVGAGQTMGATVGNGRAAALLYARAGAKVVAANRTLSSAEETVTQIASEGGEAVAMRVDVTSEADISALVTSTMRAFGRIDVLHNNVGVNVRGGDAPVTEMEAETLAYLMNVNLGAMIITCKHVLPVMRRQESGVITNISSNAALLDFPLVAYKTTKAGVVALTEHLAIRNAEFGIRANAILPGLVDTPHAVEHRVSEAKERDQVVLERQRRVPLRGRAGNAWDVAHAALFLASDEAAFITGASIVVDGGQRLRAG